MVDVLSTEIWDKAHKPCIYQLASPNYSLEKLSEVWIRLQKTVALMKHMYSHLEHNPVLLLGPVYYTHVTAHLGSGWGVFFFFFFPSLILCCEKEQGLSWVLEILPYRLRLFPWKAFEAVCLSLFLFFSQNSKLWGRIRECLQKSPAVRNPSLL